MRTLTRFAAAAALVAGSLGATQAMAGEICTGCLYTTGAFLGDHNAATFDSSGFRHVSITGSGGPFTDVWFFRLTPVGAQAQVNASFQPFNPLGAVGDVFTPFTITLRNVIAPTSCPAGPPAITVAATCISPTLGGVIGSPSVGTEAGANLGYTTLDPGLYAFVVEYSFAVPAVLQAGQTAEYSGQMNVIPLRVPEPGTLALAGIALFGAAAGLRRAKKA